VKLERPPGVAAGIAMEGVSYGVIGGLLLVLDWAVFVLLSRAGMDAAAANICGRIVGALAGFILNGTVTFRRSGSASLTWSKLLRFVIAWIGITLLSTLVVGGVDARYGLHVAWIAKPIVDGCLALLGFVVSRHWIYK
jgi:putative flippase GtrA